MRDDKTVCAQDARFDYFEVQQRTTRGRARLPVVVVKQAESLDASYRRYLGIAHLSGPVAMIGGGLARMRSGSSFAGDSESQREDILTELVALAAQQSAESVGAVVAPFVTAADISSYAAAVPGCAVQERGVWCTLVIGDARDLTELLAGMPKRCRQTWNRDVRDADSLELKHDVVPLSADTVAEALEGVVDVSRHNGLTESDDVVAWRLQNYRRRPGSHFFVRTWLEGVPVAHTLCRSYDQTIDAHTIGIADVPESQRRMVYHAAGMLGPLRLALAQGARRLELGLGHQQPKLHRGCIGENVYFADLQPA